MNRLALAPLTVPLLLCFACGGPLNQDEARDMFRSLEGRLGTGAAGQALSVDIDYETDCPRGGSASFDGAFNTENKLYDGSFTFEYEVTFEGCADSENKLDGVVQYIAMFDSNVTDESASFDLVYVYRGTIVSQGEADGTCDFDVRGLVSIDSTYGDGSYSSDIEVVYEGQMCGHDAADALDERYETQIRSGGTVNINDI